ncbi:glycoside hydrolase family 2 TIM barrel-domain containing protein [Coraliomargarita algicola]|uniref:Glycoside hydrolase family 2 TIM barrel-domain containing protein n=1 Tax=Coraliomargarita algicola TaxID=3092156 RepID=A0ABZ0RJG0_9BACT|nr:sugar-binding domain-containing protein [Coraliomargarita sp. J2-16]WPJ95613.1 glycoside hydrolase family 2 TIM barrel-domain containing protein [Coraliomargarita sp. J2-16]
MRIPIPALNSLRLILLLIVVGIHSATQASSLRQVINLAGDDWQEAIGDTIDLGEIPAGLQWASSEVPTTGLARKLKSTDNKWMYNNVEPHKYLDANGQFKVTEDRSAWFRRSVQISSQMLEGHRVYLTVAGMSYRSAVFVNGVQAGESIQSTVPLDFDLTDYVKAGENELVLVVTTREGLIDPAAAVYVAPSMGALAGVRGPIRLEFRPEIFVEDVFVKTSVQNKNIEFELSIQNDTVQTAELTPKVRVKSLRDPLNVVGQFSGSPVELAADTVSITDIKADWVAPVLWSATSPEMYIAEVSLYDGSRLVDQYEQTFGFREFSIQGKDFLLNGERVVLRRSTSLAPLGTVDLTPHRHAQTIEDLAPLNSIRQHLGANDPDLIHRANMEGILVTPEAAYSWVKIYPHDADKVAAWLPGTLDYYKRWAKQMRNEPSVVIYSLANETYWERNLPEEMAVAEQIVKVMREMDPTRPFQADGDNDWNKLLDITNIHYPEGTAGTLRLEYPNSGLQVPNDLQWLTREGGRAWRANFKWDRPLVIGEFGGGGDWNSCASYGGDDVFDWIKWQKNTRGGMDYGASDAERDNYYIDNLRRMVDFYRYMGVAGMTPWSGDKAELLKAMRVAPIDFQANVDSGGVFKRKLAVFNDEVRPLNAIEYYLTVDGILVEESRIDFYLKPGGLWSQVIELPVPEVDATTEAEFLVRLIWKRGAKDVEVDRYDESIYIVPDYDLSAMAQSIVLIDPEGSLDHSLEQFGLTGVDRLQGTQIPVGKKLAVIGTGGFRKQLQDSLDAFVAAGGVVLMLPQDSWQPYRIELPERDMRHAATQAWARMPEHPALKDMNEAQLSFWNENNVVSYGTFKKPQLGPMQVIADAGGRFGLSWSPLLDIPVGQGAFLMTTFELTTPEPAARQLLANLIRYGVERLPRTTVEFSVLSGENQAMREALDLSGALYQTELAATGPILVDQSASFDVADLQAALDDGRTLWLHGFTPETLEKVASLLPEGASLAAVPDEYAGTMPVTEDPFLAGLSNFDFAWYMPKMYHGGPIFEFANVTVDAGDWTLDLNPFESDVKHLTQPAYLMKFNTGAGTIIFDTLNWEAAVGTLTEKALRIVSSMLTNLGVGFEFAKPVDYDYSFVDLASFANMGYMDSVADDGVGGWSDQGQNDMRFFLINHSGKGNGEEDGMDMPVPDFPTDVEFVNVPYQLVDPKANANKAVLSFGSEKHGAKLMRSTDEIPVNAKADMIWALHTLSWAGGENGDLLAEYTLRYADGSEATIPVRRFIEVGDWHSPSQYPNGAIAWTGYNLVNSNVGIHSSSWKNPHPEKEIASISIQAGLSDSQYLLLAITLGREIQEKSVVLDLNFEEATAMPDMHWSASAPELVEDGLRFEHGQYALVKRGDLAPSVDLLQQPFSIMIDFTPTAKPDGYYGGLIELGSFRIMLQQHSMRLHVATLDAEGKRMQLQSSDPLTLGERVQFEFQSDGRKAVLLRNGRVDVVSDASLPNYLLEQIRFGVAGGQNYYFNGIIHQAQAARMQVLEDTI